VNGYNLKGLRNLIFSQTDWAPSQAKKAVSRLDEFINRALLRVAQEAPYLFFEKTTQHVVLADVESLNDVNNLRLTSDPRVLETMLPIGDVNATTWEVSVPGDHSSAWSGRTLELYVEAFQAWVPVEILDIWEEAGFVRISVDRPVDIPPENIKFKVLLSDIVLADDTIELKALNLHSSGGVQTLPVVGVEEIERSYTYAGYPTKAFRADPRSIDTPVETPTVSLRVGMPWSPTAPAETFEYVITHVRGRRNAMETAHNPRASTVLNPSWKRAEPYLESAPSEMSASITPTVDAVEISLPDIDATMGFGAFGGVRDNHYGLDTRIYRRTITGPRATKRFYLLDEVPGYATSYLDDGTLLTDQKRPLREVHGYQVYKVWPGAGRELLVEVRAVHRPEPLLDDNDHPNIQRDGLEVLVTRTLAYLYEQQGNHAAKNSSMQDYNRALSTLAKRYGNSRPSNKVGRKGLGSLRGLRRKDDYRLPWPIVSN